MKLNRLSTTKKMEELHNVYSPLLGRCFFRAVELNRAVGAYVASLVSSITLMIALTLLDVWVVYFILLRSDLLTSLPLFWWFPLWVMEFTFPLCIILTFENKIPLICYLFFVFGGEDTLYYLLTVGHMPEK